MIETAFRKWLARELLDDENVLRIKMSLSGNKDAMLVWKEFEKVHHAEIADMVQEQVWAYLKNNKIDRSR